MEIRKYGNKKILIADNFDENKINELYIEEEIGSE